MTQPISHMTSLTSRRTDLDRRPPGRAVCVDDSIADPDAHLRQHCGDSASAKIVGVIWGSIDPESTARHELSEIRRRDKKPQSADWGLLCVFAGSQAVSGGSY